MNRPVAHKTRRYTLVEILVAMAILVIMMSFLFQFVIGAQRIWSASESTADIFDQAQLVMELVENDLQAINFICDEDYPGHSIPMGVQLDLNGFLTNKLFFVTTDLAGSGSVGTYMTLYALSNNELSRYVFDSPIGSYSPHSFYGFDPIAYSGQAANYVAILTSVEADTTLKNVIAKGIESIQLNFLPSNTASPIPNTYFFKSVPNVVKVTIVAYDAQAVERLISTGLAVDSDPVNNKKTETARTFTKLIFIR
ncbi:PulJ/GspJ family protein [Oligosphaera ethanolica]|uniref:Type II secretory pathway component PulJ n=1 Tax=Oligosphaera ethanolica TaxID=760260 RepID=A0AAE3VIT8_9BACT|nr:hypothetical protein [Oligosphaera ethanolica]MDQ0291066.1 type II secretory pathway component PulJ [Oligosphaera ethanolica]